MTLTVVSRVPARCRGRLVASPRPSAEALLDRAQRALHPKEALDVFLGQEQRGHRIAAYPEPVYLMTWSLEFGTFRLGDCHLGEAQQVGHRKFAVLRRAELPRSRLPHRLYAQERRRISSDEPEDHLGDDATPDRSEFFPFAEDLRFLEDIAEQRGVPSERLDQIRRAGLQGVA